eukprot:jgi/Mesen1/8966/ME000056S08378
MASEDDSASLFEGMDFVDYSTLESTSAPGLENTGDKKEPASSELETSDSALGQGGAQPESSSSLASPLASTSQEKSSGPLDESLFSSMTETAQAPLLAESMSMQSDGKEGEKLGGLLPHAYHDKGVEDKLLSSESTTGVSSLAKPPPIRKKKRTTKVGYGKHDDGEVGGPSSSGGHVPGAPIDLGNLYAGGGSSAAVSALSRQASSDTLSLDGGESVETDYRGDGSNKLRRGQDMSPLEDPGKPVEGTVGSLLGEETAPSQTAHDREPGEVRESKPLEESQGPAIDEAPIPTVRKGDESEGLRDDAGGRGDAVETDAAAALPVKEGGEAAQESERGDSLGNHGDSQQGQNDVDQGQREQGEGRRGEVDENKEEDEDGEEDVEVDLELLSLEDRVGAIKKSIESKLQRLRAQASSFAAARKLAIQARRQGARNFIAAATRLKDLEEQLMEACEKEDFEAADALSQEMEGAEREAKAAAEEARVAEEQADAAMLDVEGSMEAEVALELEGAQRLKSLQEEALSGAEKALAEAQAAAAAEMERLAGEEEVAEARRRKVSLEQRVIDEEAAEMRTRVDALTRSERAEKAALLEVRQALQAELDDLLAKVRAKEAEMEEQDVLIGAVDQKISAASAKFDKMRAGLDAEVERVARVAAEVEQALADIFNEKEEVQGALKSAEEGARQLELTASAAEREAVAMEEAAEGRRAQARAAEELRERRGQLAAREKEVQEEAELVRGETAKLRAYLQEQAAARVVKQQDVAAAQQRVAHAEKRGPELDVEKRLAASSRNFKEAARLAAEAKLLTNDKESAAAEIRLLTNEMEESEKMDAEKIEQLGELESMLADKDKEASMVRCERLRLIADVARKEMEEAAEAEDFEEAESLNLEAEAADEEADALQKQHGFLGKQHDRPSKTTEKISTQRVVEQINVEKATSMFREVDIHETA